MTNKVYSILFYSSVLLILGTLYITVFPIANL